MKKNILLKITVFSFIIFFINLNLVLSETSERNISDSSIPKLSDIKKRITEREKWELLYKLKIDDYGELNKEIKNIVKNVNKLEKEFHYEQVEKKGVSSVIKQKHKVEQKVKVKKYIPYDYHYYKLNRDIRHIVDYVESLKKKIEKKISEEAKEEKKIIKSEVKIKEPEKREKKKSFLYAEFPVSGVKTWIFIPPLVALIVSFFGSMGGISGAFLLVPFQMSVLNYIAPSVSATNQCFNIVSLPGGVWGYIKEKRMVWHMVWAIIMGAAPGVLFGAWIRLQFLPDPKKFKIFSVAVLLYMCFKLFTDFLKTKKGVSIHTSALAGKEVIVKNSRFSLKEVSFDFGEESFSFSIIKMVILSFVLSAIGSIYGIAGGAIAPFIITFFKLPVYVVAGAAFMGNLVASITGVISYKILSFFYPNLSVAPDLLLGILFGIGGFFGIYLGARCQKYVPDHIIKLMLIACIMFLAIKYVIEVF